MGNERIRSVNRKTGETDISIQINLDGTGLSQIELPIPFLKHMLTIFAVHSLCDLELVASGDIDVDDHHLVEDIGICLGEVLRLALEDKRGINRYGEATIPMDETLVRSVIDLSGRAYLHYGLDLQNSTIGGLALENVPEFFQALVNNAGMNLHIDLIRGRNSHHCIEAVFKSFARALRQAIKIEPRISTIPSSKGTLG